MNELENIDNINIDALYNDVAGMIEKAKQQVAIHVNTELVILNWNIGNRIKVELLNNKKPEYGKQVIKELSKKLVRNYGRGYSSSNLYRMLQLNEFFEDFENFATLSQKLSWSHFIEIVKMDTDIKRKFYATMCINEHWSVRTLRERIGSALFERTAISKKPEQTIINDLQLLNNENKMTTDLFFRDPYILDFLELKDTYSEKDLENAIISELEKFILEMGNDFAFLARQKRITIDGRDFYIDLLFYHRKLKRLVVIELKLDEFKPEHKGQVELYLKWLDKYEKAEGEESPVAIILCATKSDTMAELLELDNSGIHVAQYLTNYVPKELLKEKFLSSIKNAKIQLEQRNKKEEKD
ncbi:MAG: PDDEXK nuclease domain-containing protein [Clostridia bacterium]